MAVTHGEAENAQNGDEKATAIEMIQRPPLRWALIIVLTALLLGGALWLVRHFTYGRYIETTNDAYLKADMVDIASKLPGYVEEVMVGDNQPVRAGMSLVRMSLTDSTAQLRQFDAQFTEAQAVIAQAELATQRQEAEILAAKAQEDEARIRLDHAKAQVARYAPLARAGAESNERLDQFILDRDVAAAGLAGATSRSVAAIRQRAAFNAQLSAARARLAAIGAQQQRARKDVDLAVLRSGVAGVVGDRTVRPGQYVQAGQRLMSIVPVQDSYVVANFKETQVKRMRIGQPVRIEVDALDGEELTGRIDSFSPGTGSEFALLPPQNATGNFTKIVQRIPVRIRLTQGLPADRVVVPGMSVVVRVDTRTRRP